MAESQRARRKGKNVSYILRQDRRRAGNVVRCLLLGLEDSGKAEVIEQLRQQYGHVPSVEEEESVEGDVIFVPRRENASFRPCVTEVALKLHHAELRLLDVTLREFERAKYVAGGCSATHQLHYE